MNGSQFKGIRERLKLSQEELATVLCLSGKQAVSNIETGFRNPSKLSAVLMLVFDSLSDAKFKELKALILKHSQSSDVTSSRSRK